MLLYSPAPHIEDSVQSSLEHHYRQRLLCQHLEQCYTQSLEPLTTRGRPAATNSAESESQDPIADSQASSIGDSGERTSILTLSQRLEGILSSTAHAGSLWGVSLADDSAERDSLLAAFLRAREWDVESADAFLRDTLAWRREQGFEGSSGSSSSSSSDGGAAPADVAAARLDFPDDTIRTLQGTELDEHSGKHTHTVVTHTVVVIRMGLITLEGLRAVEELVQWRRASSSCRTGPSRRRGPSIPLSSTVRVCGPTTSAARAERRWGLSHSSSRGTTRTLSAARW